MDKMKKMLKKRGLRRMDGQRGFTLMELLIVMSIIAVLVGIVVMSLSGFIGAGQATVCDADERTLQSAVMAFWITNGGGTTDWPTVAGGSAGLAVGGSAIVYTAQDDDGNDFVPDYILEEPGSSIDGATWSIDDDPLGIVFDSAAFCP
ncbi:MAG: type II secretion system protein [Dehalococcoidia bacterium]